MGARVGGRNLAISWIVGLLCMGIVGTLLWVALPAVPVLVGMIGATLGELAP